MVEIYAQSVQLEAQLAVRSFISSYQALQEDEGAAQIFGLVHDALNHCASISRYFWPVTKDKAISAFSAERGNALREHFGVVEGSPLQNRNLRNSLEHFDEKLDEWVLANPVGPVIATPIIADSSSIDVDFGHIFKLLDPNRDEAVLLGKMFEFGDLAREVTRIAMFPELD